MVVKCNRFAYLQIPKGFSWVLCVCTRFIDSECDMAKIINMYMTGLLTFCVLLKAIYEFKIYI